MEIHVTGGTDVSPTAEPVTIRVNPTIAVTGAWLRPDEADFAYVFAHGAGAGMHHASMRLMAEELASRGVATLRYQFPYMERGLKRTDPPELCHETVQAAVTFAATLAPNMALFAGGRSFGGRMTSQARARLFLPDVHGLILLAFPLHPDGRPSIERAAHLSNVDIPMLFVQGTRDALAELPLLESVVAPLRPRATLKLLEHADHSFHVPAKSGRKDADVRAEAADSMVAWMSEHAH